MNAGRFLERLATVALVAAALAFLALTVARNWDQLAAHEWHVRIGPLLLSTAALTLVMAWGVFVWGRVLARFEHPPVPFRTLLRVWFVSNLARYIPGKIWQFVGAVQLSRGSGLPTPLLLTSMIVHVGFSLLAALVVALLTLPRLFGATGAQAGSLAVLALIAGGALVHPAVFNGALRLVPRALHRGVLHWRGSWRDGLGLLALSLVSWSIYGAAFYLFVAAVVAIPLASLPALTGVNAASFLAGYLVFVAPAGLGFREAAMTLLLGPVAGSGVAAVIAVASRLWTVAAELIGAALALLLRSAARSTSA